MRQRAARLAVLIVVLGAAPVAAAVSSGGTAAGRARTAAQVELVVYHAPRHQQAASHVARPAQQTHQAAQRRASDALTFEWPAQGAITTPFIQTPSFHHDGIDIGSLRSTAIVAAHDGRVVHVGYTAGFEGYGQIVDVDVAPGVETLYAHLSAMDVRVGDEVKAGQRLGTAGCTGICTGTHLHFEVRK
ncbi:MAG: M23 family metallopeptidase, partial [Gaiellaceae bacterium]